MQVFRFKAQSTEWHQKRQEVITGTEISSLFDFNRYLSLTQLIKQKVSTNEKKQKQDNEILRTGRLGEVLCLASANEAGLEVESAAPMNYVEFVIDPKLKLGTSLDGIVWDKEKGKSTAECKSTSNSEKFKKWIKKELDLNYLLQIHTQMLVTNTSQAYFIGVHSHPPYPIVIFKIIKNSKIEKIIVDKLKDFWQNIKLGAVESIKVADQKTKTELEVLLKNSIEDYGKYWTNSIEQKEDKVSLLNKLKDL